MANKSAATGTKKTPAVAVDTDLKLVRLELPPNVHQLFRVEAAKEGVSMGAMARRLVEEWVAKWMGGGK